MTVIAWDGRTLAADKQSTDVGLKRTVTKIRRLPSGELVGMAGDHAVARAVARWYEAGRQGGYPDSKGVASLLVITTDGQVRVYSEGTPDACEFEDAFYALGSGRDFATAAMDLGKTAAEGVELACKWEQSCGRGIDVLELRAVDGSNTANSAPTLSAST